MNVSLPALRETKTMCTWMLLIATTIMITACSGGTSSSPPAEPVAVECIPDDPSTLDRCGTVYIGLTDADGDFLSYSVDVISLELVRADGVVVETLPNNTRINFTEYVDLTEFVSAAFVPPGSYVSGNITLDYVDAEVLVEAAGEATDALIVDERGNALGQVTMRIKLADRNQLLVSRGRPSLLTVDFDLDASHSVDVTSTPALATAEPFIVAEIDPVDEKDIRVRGPLLEVSEDAMNYTVDLRPFYDRVGDFGRVTVNVTNDTEFEVDESAYFGAEGLHALNAAGQGTPTIALGTLDVTERQFTANLVLAGSSVPGSDKDAVKGNVIARDGNTLTVRGATVILSNESPAFFHDDITVTIGADTKIFKRSRDGLLDINAISVGQRITVLGMVDVNDRAGIHIDATSGAVRMHVTHLSGVINSVMPGQTDIELHAIDRRRADVFDFSGTGLTGETDADPRNYEVATGDLLLENQSAGRPVIFYGFPNAFGAAPPDFEGRSVVDFVDVRGVLGVGWGTEGTTMPFLSMESDGLTLDNENPAIDQRHHIKQGPVLIDLTSLESGTVIAPRESGRMLFSIKTADSLQLFADFDDFVNALTLEFGAAKAARSMHARGLYNADTNVFTAYKIGIHLLEP